MGKNGKEKQRHSRKPPRGGGASYYSQQDEEEEDDDYPYNGNEQQLSTISKEEEEEEEEEEENEDENDINSPMDVPSKFLLYQQSVQSPKGDISYMLKFFLMYVGGRLPLHLQEDFCGTALLSTEWLRGDPRRTAVGLDLDIDALNWCMENNVKKVGADGFSRISLLHGNVLHPLEATLLKFEPENLIRNISLEGIEGDPETVPLESAMHVYPSTSTDDRCMNNFPLRARDIVCAFNYSSCCLHRRGDLILYFKHVLNALSKKGGIFVMDLYGGTSSECKLKLQRRFPHFTYIWEQAEFDIIQRRTRISLHYHLQKQQKRLRHAFSYSWRLWSLPEIKDCLEEVGFQSVHFWIQQMPDTKENRSAEGFGIGREVKYEEVTSFQQQDAWNAYIVGVAKKFPTSTS
ncbi:uncharacterized protein LOC131149184 [Malania oleifera]|uniref:uncharacterized protein LOC131149184 n=1 Tax=Malania oleifera TaxID=397392 RepID=UPI0025AE03D6|nr:uncharacterized protein LOC131149184 [Malania oleifera]